MYESREYEKSLEENGHRDLNYLEDLALKKGVKIQKILKSGAIYTEILKTADEIDADLIVLGGWQQDRNTRDLISHSHMEVLYHAKSTVMVVKEQNVDSLYKRI